MWVLFARAPALDRRVWPGRCLLAVFDAAAWPAMFAIGIGHLPWHTGIAGQIVLAVCATAAMRRLWCACFVNQRYAFTTASIGAKVAWLLAIGAMLKLAT